MIKTQEIKGAVFDVDGTLLDDCREELGGAHNHSRLLALQQIAKKYDIAALKDLTVEENRAAFVNAKFSSLEGAAWNVLFQKGIVDSSDLDPDHELLLEIVALKNEIHAGVMRQYGRPVLGAVELVNRLAGVCGPDKLAIASSATRRDIDVLVDELTDLRQFFPSDRIVSHSDVPHGFGKPHPRPFELAFQTLGVPEIDRDKVVAFEDDPRGVRSAKKAGLYVCAITTTFDRAALQASGPHMIIDCYAEFQEQLG